MRCEHLCDTTTRYDHGRKELSFLLRCAVCGTEELVETVRYEPSQRGTRLGGLAPSALASTGSHSRTGAGSSSTTL